MSKNLFDSNPGPVIESVTRVDSLKNKGNNHSNHKKNETKVDQVKETIGEQKSPGNAMNRLTSRFKKMTNYKIKKSQSETINLKNRYDESKPLSIVNESSESSSTIGRNAQQTQPLIGENIEEQYTERITEV